MLGVGLSNATIFPSKKLLKMIISFLEAQYHSFYILIILPKLIAADNSQILIK